MSASLRPAAGSVASAPATSTSTSTSTPSPSTPFTLRGDHIALDALLKATGIAGSGGHAKLLITAGEVRVDGEIEVRRSCKIRPGQTVDAAGQQWRLVAGTATP